MSGEHHQRNIVAPPFTTIRGIPISFGSGACARGGRLSGSAQQGPQFRAPPVISRAVFPPIASHTLSEGCIGSHNDGLSTGEGFRPTESIGSPVLVISRRPGLLTLALLPASCFRIPDMVGCSHSSPVSGFRSSCYPLSIVGFVISLFRCGVHAQRRHVGLIN